MKFESRNYGLDILRLLCMFMLATYHFINIYGQSFIDPNINGIKAYFVQNLGWGGGRMICNVFFIISVWFLCEKDFKVERLLKVLFTVLVYSLITGIIFYTRTSDKSFLVAHCFPIATNLVWYATMYMGIIILSPLLNRLLEEKNKQVTKVIVLVFVVIVCIVPTFYPKYSRLGSVFSWYALAYLIIGLMKVNNFEISKAMAIVLFTFGWAACLLFYNSFMSLKANPVLAHILTELGFYDTVYFADLATLPPFVCALGLFYFFKDCDINTLSPYWGGKKSQHSLFGRVHCF